MYRMISARALYILRSLNHTPMTKKQLSRYLNFMSILGQADDADLASIDRDVRFLQRWGLIQWARQQQDIHRIYHITEMGRRFLKDCILIESNRFFEEYRGFTSVATILDLPGKNERNQYINMRRAFINKMIGELRKSQSVLGKKERARGLLIQYHLYRLQGELGWLRDISGSQGAQNEQR